MDQMKDSLPGRLAVVTAASTAAWLRWIAACPDLTAYLEVVRGERPPDAECQTTGDGQCVAPGPCMHSEGADRLAYDLSRADMASLAIAAGWMLEKGWTEPL